MSADGGRRLRRGRRPRHLLPPLRARLRHAHERQLRRLLGQLDDGLQPGHDRHERQLLPLPLLDRRQRRQPLGHRHRLRRCQSRHLGAFLHRDLPGLGRDVQHRRLERRLRDGRSLRHLLRRRLGSLPGTGLYPPGHGQLLERIELRERAARSGTRPRSPPATGRTHSRRAASPPTAATPSGCARPTRPGTSRPRTVAASRSTASRRRRRSTRTRRTRRASRAPPSPSAPTRAARASSAGSTAAPGAPARARRATRASPTAATPSTCAPPTSPATRMRRPPPTPGWSTRRRPAAPSPSRPRAASTTQPAGRRAAPRPACAARTRTERAPASRRCRSPSARARATTGTAPASRAAPRSGTRQPRGRQLVVRVCGRKLPGGRQLHRAGARGRRGRQHRDPVEPDVHVRHDEPERALHLPRRRAATTRTRPGTPAARRTASAARTPTPAPASRPSQVSIQRVSTGLYWNGTSFASGSEAVPDRDARRRQLVADLPGVELPGRRSVHGPRARARRRAATPRPALRARSGSTTPRPSSTVTFPASCWHLQHRRLERRLRDERPLRHALRRAARASRGRGLHPPGRRQLLERLRLLQRAPRSGTRPRSPAATGR